MVDWVAVNKALPYQRTPEEKVSNKKKIMNMITMMMMMMLMTMAMMDMTKLMRMMMTTGKENGDLVGTRLELGMVKYFCFSTPEGKRTVIYIVFIFCQTYDGIFAKRKGNQR